MGQNLQRVLNMYNDQMMQQLYASRFGGYGGYNNSINSNALLLLLFLRQAAQNGQVGQQTQNTTTVAEPANLKQILEQLKILQNNSKDTQNKVIVPRNKDITSKSSDIEKRFDTMDIDKDGKVTEKEYLEYYMLDKENKLGKKIDTNSPEYAKYAKEAQNMFDAMKETHWFTRNGFDKARFREFIDFVDRADGNRDGIIRNKNWNRIVESIKEKGEDAEVTAGKTLPDIIG